MTQERAVRTRAAILDGAATEFARYGYAGSSVTRILDNTSSTKGAMYFHFSSKQEIAVAVLDTAAAAYTAIAARWSTADGVPPLDAIAGMVDDAAQAFDHDVSLRAEARLSVEPDFHAHRSSAAWEAAILDLADRAAESGSLREGFTAERFVRVLAASLAGYRLLAHIVPTGFRASIAIGYRESLDTVLAAARNTAATDAASEEMNTASPLRRATEDGDVARV
ncbi:TetR family transcriptional regulator [Rhodococcus sp. MALMAid1271]|uniref:TetR family transcriptional regulator n=1 Tax=Rhodococcus sp. MALMAid1271 TaxID=3411744 RepID=UPI003B9E2412